MHTPKVVKFAGRNFAAFRIREVDMTKLFSLRLLSLGCAKAQTNDNTGGDEREDEVFPYLG